MSTEEDAGAPVDTPVETSTETTFFTVGDKVTKDFGFLGSIGGAVTAYDETSKVYTIEFKHTKLEHTAEEMIAEEITKIADEKNIVDNTEANGEREATAEAAESMEVDNAAEDVAVVTQTQGENGETDNVIPEKVQKYLNGTSVTKKVQGTDPNDSSITTELELNGIIINYVDGLYTVEYEDGTSDPSLTEEEVRKLVGDEDETLPATTTIPDTPGTDGPKKRTKKVIEKKKRSIHAVARPKYPVGTQIVSKKKSTTTVAAEGMPENGVVAEVETTPEIETSETEIRGTITRYNTETEKFVVTVEKTAEPDDNNEAGETTEAVPAPTEITELEYTEKELADQFDLTIPPPKYTAGLLVRKNFDHLGLFYGIIMTVSENNLYPVQYEDDELEEYDETEIESLIVYKEDAPTELWAFVQDAPSRQPRDKVSPPPPPPSLVDDETKPLAETTATTTEAEPKTETTEEGEEAKPSEGEDPKPSTTEFTDAEPSEAKPVEEETAETKPPLEGETAETTPAEIDGKPADEDAPTATPAIGDEAKPNDATEAKPVDAEVSKESKPADTEPAAEVTEAVESAVKTEPVAPIFTDPKTKLEQLKLALQAMKKAKAKRQYKKRVYKQKYKNGTKVRKQFPNGEWYNGKVVAFDSDAKYYRVRYEDDDEEEYTQKELEGIMVGNVMDTDESGYSDQEEESDEYGDDDDDEYGTPSKRKKRKMKKARRGRPPSSGKKSTRGSSLSSKKSSSKKKLLAKSSSGKKKSKSKPSYTIGTKVAKFFPSFGKFKGKVISYNKATGLYGVEYEDGDNEDVSENELDTIAVVKKDISVKKRKGNNDDDDDLPLSTPKKKLKSERFKRKYRNGTEVAKYFNGYGFSKGDVVNFEEDTGLYSVVFEEGNYEYFTESKLEKIITKKIPQSGSAGGSSSKAPAYDSDDDDGGIDDEEEITIKKRKSLSTPKSKKSSEKRKRIKDSFETKVRRSFKRKYEDGTEVSKFFPGHGNFKGKVVDFDKNGGLYQVEYEDGDREELTEVELKKVLATTATIPTAPKTPDGRLFPNGLLVKKILPDGGKLDGIVRSFRKVTNRYRILYHDGDIDDLTEEELAKMVGTDYVPKAQSVEDVEMADAPAESKIDDGAVVTDGKSDEAAPAASSTDAPAETGESEEPTDEIKKDEPDLEAVPEADRVVEEPTPNETADDAPATIEEKPEPIVEGATEESGANGDTVLDDVVDEARTEMV